MNRIKELREARNIPQKTLAIELGVSGAHFSGFGGKRWHTPGTPKRPVYAGLRLSLMRMRGGWYACARLPKSCRE